MDHDYVKFYLSGEEFDKESGQLAGSVEPTVGSEIPRMDLMIKYVKDWFGSDGDDRVTIANFAYYTDEIKDI
ncbi:hypothetical protein O9929_20430 [Vibrio lentus]|nr:hypothetical protein [Vibrio lentus]